MVLSLIPADMNKPRLYTGVGVRYVNQIFSDDLHLWITTTCNLFAIGFLFLFTFGFLPFILTVIDINYTFLPFILTVNTIIMYDQGYKIL